MYWITAAIVGATLAVAPIWNMVAPNGNVFASKGNTVNQLEMRLHELGNMAAPNGNPDEPIGNAILSNENLVALMVISSHQSGNGYTKLKHHYIR